MKKYIYIAGGLLLVALIAWGLRPQPVAIDLAKVTSGPMRVTVDEEGKTRIKERYTVVAPLTGQMRRIELKPGDVVRPGHTILTVIEPADPALLDARAVASCKARVSSASAAKDQAGQMLNKAKVAADFGEMEFRRTKSSFEGHGTSDQNLKEAEMFMRTKQAELKAAQFAERIAQFEMEQAESTLLQVSPGNSAGAEPARMSVPSPIAGSVLNVFRESAGLVTAGTALIELGDPKDLEVVVQVLSRDAVQIRLGADAYLEQWGGEKPLRASVRRVEPAGFTKISALGVEEQRVNVLLDFTDPLEMRATLGDNYRVEARIVVWEKDNVVKVPAGALYRHNGDWAVFRAENGIAKEQIIKVGRNNPLEAEVLEGLQPGDQVVMHPGDRVKDRVKVIGRE
jgi:HlyD family secretion protein